MTATRKALGAIGTAAATLAAWWAWLGWDTEYEIDPVTSTQTGPYETWQVVGCVLTLAVLAVVAGLLLPPWLVAVAMTVSFTVAWTAGALASDESGLWVVGAIGVFIGMAVGSTVLSVVAWAVRRALSGRRSDRPQGTSATR
jgi:hypothetical protein